MANYSFVTNQELDQEYILWIKRRFLEQKFSYLDGWAHLYYGADKHYIPSDLSKTRWMESHFLDGHLLKEESIAIVSLGCGNWMPELWVLKALSDVWFDIEYFGVDISDEMLDLARWVWEKQDRVKSNFICADFTAVWFKNKLLEIVKKFDRTVYLFLWWTFGNVNQTLITDSLYNMMQNNDLLRVEVSARDSDEQSKIIKLFDRYSGWLKNNEKKEFRINTLKKIGLDYSMWKMVLESKTEPSVWTIEFTYYFEVTSKAIINYEWEKIHILPQERIRLNSIRNYNIDKFEDFLKEHDFNLIQRQIFPINSDLSLGAFLFTI